MRNLALFLSFSVGFLSLSQEIVWVRLVSFSLHGSPHAFPLVLALFLIGIALGAKAGRRLCERCDHLIPASATVLLVASSVDLVVLKLAPPCLANFIEEPRCMLFLMALIAVTAGLKGTLFPIVHHLGSDGREGRVGRSVSRIYLGNVLGSTLGPIVTGFWLFDRMTVEASFALIASCTALLGAVTLAYAHPRPRTVWLLPAGVIAIGLFLTLYPPDIVAAMVKGHKIKHVIQNKHGIIHVVADEEGNRGNAKGDITFGGNCYDGRINVDMSANSNLLDRAYLAGLLHPAPRRVLVIGMSTGAWTRVIAGMPGIQQIEVVEINPGYVDLVRAYPAVSPILRDPRVHIHIDDGRRWLRAHPKERFDLVFQNTTYHWRAYTTMLLSREYFGELKSHLNPGGIIAANTTGSEDVYRTALAVFPHAIRYVNFVYMGDQPLSRRSDSENFLRLCTIGERRAFPDALFEKGGIGAQLLRAPLEPAEAFLRSASRDDPPQVITDLNLLTEFRHAKPSL